MCFFFFFFCFCFRTSVIHVWVDFWCGDISVYICFLQMSYGLIFYGQSVNFRKINVRHLPPEKIADYNNCKCLLCVYVFDRSIRPCQFMRMYNNETFNGSRINHFIFLILTLIFEAETVFYLIFVLALCVHVLLPLWLMTLQATFTNLTNFPLRFQ